MLSPVGGPFKEKLSFKDARQPGCTLVNNNDTIFTVNY